MNGRRGIFRWLAIGWMICTALVAEAQTRLPAPILFKNPGQISPALMAIDPASPGLKAAAEGNISRVFLQFARLPDKSQKQILLSRGIELLEYIPENTFLASIRGKWSVADFKSLGITATVPLSRQLKNGTNNGNAYPKKSRAEQIQGNYHLTYIPSLSPDQFRSRIHQLFAGSSIQAGAPVFLGKQLVEISLSAAALDRLLDQPFVLYVMPARPIIALNSDATDHLNAQMVQIGNAETPALTGAGVVMAVGDEGRVDHIDNGYNEEGQDYNSNYHSTHVAGTMIGAGIVNPYMKGFAPKATLLVDFFNTIIYRAPEYYQSKHLVLTNNSYGIGSYCVPYSGEYSGYSGQVDQQMLDYPNMMHVFAAGNSGGLQCGNVPAGYRAIDNAFQAGKNIITVGGTSHDGLTNKFSKGPVNDGRVKPELVGIGNAMISTIMGNGYGSNQGTSMAAPQITGALALIYERYRLVNGGQDPTGDLVKAIACNTATDIGTRGVDFSNGFGWLNVKRAIDVVNAKSYWASDLEQNQEHSIDVQLDKEAYDFRIMLYWHDRPASYYALKNLVNDLDLTVQLPDGTIYTPMVLDTSAAGLLNPAVMGKDHMNNIEQVVIPHALPGKYTIRINGYNIPYGPQPYKIVYNWELPGLKLIQPIGGEQWKPGELRGIHWEDAGRQGDSYKFELSADNGGSWTTINGLTANYNLADWTVPNIVSAAARIRITNTGSGESFVSPTFTIMPEINFKISSACASSLNVHWTKPAGIDSVAVLLYKSGEFETQTITADTVFEIKELRSGPYYWVTVQPVLNGRSGERSIAQQIVTAAVNCVPAGPAGDLELKAILLPANGREGTSTAPAAPIPIALQLYNNGSTILPDNIFLDLFVNGVSIGKDTLIKALAGGEQFNWNTDISFTATPGSSSLITAQIIIAGDPVATNNQRDTSWLYLSNPPLVLPFTENFSTLKDSIYTKPGIIGAAGAEAWDFLTPSPALQLVTGAQDTLAGFSIRSKIGEQPFQLIGTYNLSAYTRNDNIRAKLIIPSLGEMNSPGLFIRGSDTQAWLPVPYLDSLRNIYHLDNLDISGVLARGNQDFSSSFQVRLTGSSDYYLNELELIQGFGLFTVSSDLALVDLQVSKANLTDGDQLQVTITVQNNLLTNAPAFKVNLKTPDGQIQSVDVASLAPGAKLQVPITVSVSDWPVAGFDLQAWVDNSAEPYRSNDSLTKPIVYYRKISQFPYLEGFEQGAAGWHPSYMYRLSNELTESVQNFKPANGKVFWGTNFVDYIDEVAIPVSEGFLESPLFDLSNLKSPWISMSVNKKLCAGTDKLLMQYSVDTGNTWIDLPDMDTAVNWYNNADHTGWENCGDDYWQVISAPIPASGSGILLRLYSQPANPLASEFPRLPGGMLVDDVHVYDYQFPIYTEPVGVVDPAHFPQNGLIYYTETDRLLAAEKPASGAPVNKLTLSAPEPNRSYLGNPVFSKSWIFNGSNTKDSSARVRLYFGHDEIMGWLNTIDCDTCKEKLGPYDLSVFRYSGPNDFVNNTETDNAPGSDEVWQADAFNLVPYGAGYYAEVPASAYGEFYLGLGGAYNNLYFNALRQDNADIVLLYWQMDNTVGIDHFEVERAKKEGAALNFETINTTPAILGTNEYRFRDTRIDPPGTWVYRLKMVYNNGKIRYSALRTISFENFLRAKLYPNPTPDGRVNLLLQYAEGKKVELTLFDQGGRQVWKQHLQAIAQQQVVPLEIGGGRLPNGVYALRITTAAEKLTLQLVISRN